MMNRLFSRSNSSSAPASSSSSAAAVNSTPRLQIQHNHHNHHNHNPTMESSSSASASAVETTSLPLSPLRPRTASTSGPTDTSTSTGVHHTNHYHSTSMTTATTTTTTQDHHPEMTPTLFHSSNTYPTTTTTNSSSSSSATSNGTVEHPSTSSASSSASASSFLSLPTRRRLNSRDIPRTYSGLYGQGDDDLLPFELNRHSQNHHNQQSIGIMWGWYVTLILLVQVVMTLIIMTPNYTWTCTNVVHTVVTLVYIHWLKGSLYDDSGEMDALTLWEQLEATPHTRAIRETLMVIPCFLTWLACHASNYGRWACVINGICWVISMLAKLPFMNGVRLFGINRTAGIDDDHHRRGNDTTHTTSATDMADVLSSSSPSSSEDADAGSPLSQASSSKKNR